MKLTEPSLTESPSTQPVSSASYYLKGGAVILATGAAYAVAKTTGALSWLWSGLEAYTTGSTVSEGKSLQTTTSAIQATHETDSLLISSLKPPSISSSSRSVEELDSLDLVELDSTPISIKSEELSTGEGEKFSAASDHYHNRQLLWVPLTDAFQVNTYTVGDQTAPAIATLSSGGFVVTWTSDLQDGNSYGVYAQRYDSAGVAQGSEFQVNTYTIGVQAAPNIAALSTGGFLVAWHSDGQDGSSWGVYAQRYNSINIAQGVEFRVNTYTDYEQIYPSIATLITGDFVVTWTSSAQDGDNYGIYAQRYNSVGVVQGSEFRVNSYTTNGQAYPSIAALSIEGFVVVWISNMQDGDSLGVYGQRYDSVNVAQDAEFQVNTYTIGDQNYPVVAALSTGDFVVTWQSGAQDGSDGGVYAQRYSSTGVPQGVEFRVNTYTEGYQGEPSITALSAGGFVVTWFDLSANFPGIYAQRYNSVGVTQGAGFRLNTYTTGFQLYPSIAALTGEDFVVTWRSDGQDGNGAGIYARIIRGNQMPVIINNQLTLKDNETISLTSGMLNATDADIDYDSSNLNFIISNVQHGRFAFTSNSSIAITQFTQQQVQSNLVQFIHAGDNQAPSFNTSVSDGELTTPSQSASVTFNYRPLINNNTLSIKDGETIIITSAMLSATDGDIAVGSLNFSVTSVQHGQFELVSSPGVAITQFIQAQVQAAQVRFVHDGSNTAPAYQVSVSDGTFNSTLSSATIAFDQRPVIVNRTFSMNDNATLLITPTMLSATDDRTNTSALTFAISNLQHGRFELISNPGVALTQFTQGQVQSSQIRFVHDGSNQTPSWQISVNDGVLSSANVSAVINFNQRPVLVNNTVSINDNATMVITSGMLSASDDQTTAGALNFTISGVQHGRFELMSNPGVTITQFTQLQIQNGQVQFVHDGSNVAPSYQVSVSDGTLSSSVVAATIVFNQHPLMVNNTVSLNDNATVVITSGMLSATDDKTTAGALIFTVSNVQRGRFELLSNPGVVITQFTQSQIQNNQVQFVHDGSNAAPSYQVRVSDGTLSSPAVAATIVFNQHPVVVNNTLSLNDNATVVMTSGMLSATDDKTTAGALNFTVNSVQRGRFELVSNPGVVISQFTQSQVQNGQVQFVHDGSNAAPSYQISVSDGTLSSPAFAATIVFNQHPVMINNTISLNDNATVVITSGMLSAIDDKTTASALIFTVSSVQRGRFELISNPGVAIIQFTQSQVQNSQVQFVHDGSNIAPSYGVSVSDGILNSTAAPATIIFNQRPLLVNNNLSLKDSESVLINSTMLSASDDKTAAGALNFMISNVQHGYFELMSNPGVAITQFTQAQIQAASVHFVHDGSNSAPAYQVSISDGTLNSPLSSVTITFDQRPIIVNRIFSVNENATLLVTPAMLSATDDRTNTSALTFSVSSLQHGRFELVSNLGVAITQFTQGQIQAGQIRFVHDGSNQAPSWQISVNDGVLSSANVSAVINFNQRPVLVNNTVSLNDNATVVITSGMLSAADDITTAGALNFTISGMQHGRFELLSNPGVAVTQFTQGQIQASQVYFVHDGSNQAPSWQVNVNDGVLSSANVAAIVNFNQRPVMVNNTISLNDNATMVITSGMLSASDDKTTAGALNFTVSSVQRGRFELVRNPGLMITQFTQSQVQNSQVQFVHDGSNVAPSYQVSVSDGTLSSPTVAATIVFNQRPVLVNNSLALKDGETLLINSTMLSASDDKTMVSALNFTVSGVQHGRFELMSNPGVAITQFTQGQIQAGQVRFVHDGSNQAPSWQISVNDGVLSSANVSAVINFNQRPVLVNNTVSLNDNATVVITSGMLSAADDITTAGALNFTISGMQHGRFELVSNPGVTITQFTQSQVQNGQVQFVHDGSNAAPNYQVSVSDGVMSSPTATATIAFNQRPVLLKNTLSLKDGDTIIVTTTMLNASDDKTTANALSFTISNMQHGQFESVGDPGNAIIQFTQAQIQANQIRFMHDGNNIAPSYQVSVSDGIIALSPVSASISFNQRPVIINNKMIISQGGAITVTPAVLSATDDNAMLTFTISGLQHGRFELISSPGIAITQFTQAQIQASQVRFVHDDSNITPSYQVSVNDGILSSPVSSAAIDFNLIGSEGLKKCAIAGMSSYQSDDVVCTAVRGIVIGIPSSLGTILLAAIGYWLTKRQINNSWADNCYQIHNVLRHKLQLHIGVLERESIYEQTIFSLIGRLLAITPLDGEKEAQYSHRVGETIKGLSAEERERYSLVLVAAIRDHIHFPKLYCDRIENKSNGESKSVMPIYRHFYEIVPNPLSCFTTYKFQPRILLRSSETVIVSAREYLASPQLLKEEKQAGKSKCCESMASFFYCHRLRSQPMASRTAADSKEGIEMKPLSNYDREIQVVTTDPISQSSSLINQSSSASAEQDKAPGLADTDLEQMKPVVGASSSFSI